MPLQCIIDAALKYGKEIGMCICPFLKPHVDYWWCFDNNIQELRDGIRDLDRQTVDVERRIEAALRNAETIRPGVEEWLEESSNKLAEARTSLPNDNIPDDWKLIPRYSMGKRAKKAAEKIAKHRNDGNFDTISDPAPPASIASSQTHTMDFESRKWIEEKIMESLKNSSISTIAICGMGGVGKTTMAERIEKRVKEENLFDEVVKVTVSQNIDMLKIQDEIAEWLKLKFDEKHMSTRAAILGKRLMDTKRKIIIFDDVWESLKFEHLGIPIDSNFERCKVLLTSRSRDSCKRIKTKKVFELKILEKDEGWILFKDKTGDCVEDVVLHPVAKAIAAECKGLPIALVTVGLALQDETDIHTWKYSLSKLKEAKPTDLPIEIMTHVYLSLELSYDKLDPGLEKMFFLMCCLFPEDYDIPIEHLTWYSMGLRLFVDDSSTVEEATNKTHSLVGKLKSRFLLIDGRDKLHVKMHDVVRDVAIYIGSKEKNGFLKSLHKTSIENSKDANCNWLSVDISNEQMEVPALSRFPKLLLLRLSSNEFYDISHMSFEGIEGLNVLSFLRVSIGSLPPKLGSLKNLQTLCLFRCEVENISVIGELTSLEIFSCYGCKNITDLPADIGRLKGLTLLELNGCYKLQRIPFGVISSLRGLEELKMRQSFRRWEAGENGKEGRNASLRELECLPNLSCLEIEIDDCTLSAQKICLSQNFVKYYIRIGSQNYWDDLRDYEKVMYINLPSDIGAVGKWIQKRVRNTEYLHLQGDGSGSNNFNIAETECLRDLRVNQCSTVKKLDIVFRSLERLRLEKLKNLEEIREGTIIPNQNVSLCNLKFIKIESCPKLRSLFSVSLARRWLLQLEVLEIEDCAKLEQVFSNEIRDETDGCIEFPKLKELRLWKLQNLTAFFQGLENIIIKFPNLTEMSIGGLPKLNSLSPLNSETVVRHDQNTCFHFVCNPKVQLGSLTDLALSNFEDNIRNIWCHQIPNIVFNNLVTLRISEMNGIRSLMSTSIAKKLVNLQSLNIYNCREMVEVIERDDDDKQVAESLSLRGDGSDNINVAEMDNLRNLEFTNSSSVKKLENTDDNTDGCIGFPKLKDLRLGDLPNYTAFCQGLENVKFPNLTSLSIGKLPKLNSLCPLNSETLVWHDDQNTCFHFVCNPKDLALCNSGDNIRNIWCHQIPNKVFYNLETLYIYDMNGIKSLMSTSMAKALVSLKALGIRNCIEMVEVIERDDDDKQVAESRSLGGDGSDNINLAEMDNLRNLEFTNSSTVKKLVGTSYLNQNISLCNLTSIRIRRCPKLRSLFSGSMATRCLLQLEVLEIAACDSMEQVFWNEIRDDNTYGCIEFPKLKELTLDDLPNLTAFFQGLENIIIKFPNLRNMSIRGLPKLNSLCPLNSETLVWHDQNTCFHFVCNPKVELGSLTNLTFSNFGDNIRNIWCHQIPNNFFNNLDTLSILDMNGIVSLMSTSIAKYLVSLKYLYIIKCKEMVEVIERNDDDKQGVDMYCLFPNLKILKIKELPKLRRFWHWNHALELPLLERVFIDNCPVMETFTLGSINTTKIMVIYVNNKRIDDQKDLNNAIHQYNRTLSQNKDEGKNEDVDEEGKGED